MPQVVQDDKIKRLTSLLQEAFLSGFVHLFLDILHVLQNLAVKKPKNK